MIYLERPADFKSRYDVVAAFVEANNQVLFLQRLLSKPEGGLWGLPAGKVDPGESLHTALFREVREETNLRVHMFSKITQERSVFVRWPQHKDFVYHMFRLVCFETQPRVELNPNEHSGCGWFSPLRSLQLAQVTDQAECTRLVYGLP
jgi:8-oxo-dGTP pyrophosphatase MutT (NUDIX family)